MKFKVLSRSGVEWSGALEASGVSTSEAGTPSVPGPRRKAQNPDPLLHPFERAREQKRALNAAKLERTFAKPLIGSLHRHSDGVYALCRSRARINVCVSASADGHVVLWNVAAGSSANIIHQNEHAHMGFIRDVSFTKASFANELILTCSDDKTVKLWSEDNVDFQINKPKKEQDLPSSSPFFRKDVTANKSSAGLNNPIAVYTFGEVAFNSVDAHWKDHHLFATASDRVLLWDINRSDPVQNLQWGDDTIHKLVFNPVETDILAATSADRSVGLYDVRLQNPVRKLVMKMKSQAVAWNPMEAYHFTLGNENGSCYTYDMRIMKQALKVHNGHANAVIDVDYSPTGTEFASASYDCSIRIFPVSDAYSRDVYHTKRMQRVFAVTFTGDSRYLLSGSDDSDIRIWKTKASEPLKPLVVKEKDNLNYNQKLKERYQHVPEVKRILAHRHVPKHIYTSNKEKEIIKRSQKRKERNRKRTTAPGTVVVTKSEKEKAIVKELE